MHPSIPPTFNPDSPPDIMEAYAVIPNSIKLQVLFSYEGIEGFSDTPALSFATQAISHLAELSNSPKASFIRVGAKDFSVAPRMLVQCHRLMSVLSHKSQSFPNPPFEGIQPMDVWKIFYWGTLAESMSWKQRLRDRILSKTTPESPFTYLCSIYPQANSPINDALAKLDTQLMIQEAEIISKEVNIPVNWGEVPQEESQPVEEPSA